MIHTIIFAIYSSMCFKLNDKHPVDIKACYLNSDIVTRDYEFWGPISYRKIPYRSYCEYVACKYENCDTTVYRKEVGKK